MSRLRYDTHLLGCLPASAGSSSALAHTVKPVAGDPSAPWAEWRITAALLCVCMCAAWAECMHSVGCDQALWALCPWLPSLLSLLFNF